VAGDHWFSVIAYRNGARAYELAEFRELLTLLTQ
jgi:hypothetical protein